MIHVTIADDHPLVREGIKKVLDNEIDIKLMSEASNGGELLECLRDQLPDIVILDITMPGKSGLDLLKDIGHLYPDIPVLILSVHSVSRFAVRALRAGAMGYLTKASISEKLVNAIRKITNQHRKYITPEVAEEMAAHMNQNNANDAPLHESLSDREFEVLCMIAKGDNVHTIADNLSLSKHTVHTYRSRIKEKMNLASNVEMTRYALEYDLIT